MPLVEITYTPHLPETTLRELGSVLPHLVSLAVECPEEPYDGDLQPGDVELRFRTPGPFDRFGLDLLVEVRSKWFPSRADNRQERVDLLRTSIESATGIDDVGVYLALPVAAWSQSD
ncbi:hypothetical protein [Amycolatopsis keratiniphila]|uniref:5-carboxymethyl-2-hydroxymuconate isomerase n=1 Tax=Amycolatopsis keratiniphila subsp. keratiniphila TaxID=227715 RepID=A0A1W2M3E0_9PSEU|nr:hypothetical protein [Amycolatopsis keratiniphila]ONF74596.1 hypothetical protein AVR91_0201845 [Amycolatopsis keratiniphila subsp. keratiniphila]